MAKINKYQVVQNKKDVSAGHLSIHLPCLEHRKNTFLFFIYALFFTSIISFFSFNINLSLAEEGISEATSEVVASDNFEVFIEVGDQLVSESSLEITQEFQASEEDFPVETFGEVVVPKEVGGIGNQEVLNNTTEESISSSTGFIIQTNSGSNVTLITNGSLPIETETVLKNETETGSILIDTQCLENGCSILPINFVTKPNQTIPAIEVVQTELGDSKGSKVSNSLIKKDKSSKNLVITILDSIIDVAEEKNDKKTTDSQLEFSSRYVGIKSVPGEALTRKASQEEREKLFKKLEELNNENEAPNAEIIIDEFNEKIEEPNYVFSPLESISSGSVISESVSSDPALLELVSSGSASLESVSSQITDWWYGGNNEQLDYGQNIQAVHSQYPQRGSGVVVAVIDTGVNIDHPDLQHARWVNQNEIPDNQIDDDENGYVDDVSGWNFYDQTNDFIDDFNHGTHIAGLIAAADNDIGVIGVASEAKIMSLKVCSLIEGCPADRIIEAVNYAVNQKANIIVIALGSPYYSYFLELAVENAQAANIILVASAGNAGIGTLYYPAAYNSVVSVSATNQVGNLAPFSNTGAGLDFSAPGVNIFSTTNDNQYAVKEGTSQSAGIVAGIFALAREYFPNTLAQDLINVAKITARDLGVADYDLDTGYGLIDLLALFNLNEVDISILSAEFSDQGVRSGSGQAQDNPIFTPQAVATFQAKGAFTSGAGALSVPVPAGYQDNDVFLLFVESANEAIATPAGWTQTNNSPQSTGVAVAAGGVRLAVFYKIVSGAQANVAVADSGDHTTAIIANFRGVDIAAPIHMTIGKVDSVATSALSASGFTTTVNNALIINAIGLDKDLADADTISSVTNTSLINVTEQHDQTVSTGVGGGIAFITGEKVSAGLVSNTTATGDTATTHAYITIALKPQIDMAVATTGTQTGIVVLSSTGNYIGGAFTFASNSGQTVSQIIVTESGSVNANTNLSNLQLYYKQEATCSTAVPADATVFNNTGVSFNTSEQATVTGSMIVGTSQICIYPKLDISANAGSGQTIEIEISKPSTNVTTSTGTVTPATAIRIAGTTTIKSPTLTVATTGTQTGSVALASTGNYIGGAFTFLSSGSQTVSQIIVTESGTVSANNNLSNLQLYYKQQATCSTSVPTDATVFNNTGVSFNTSEQATVTGSMVVGTSQVCIYPKLDVGTGATIEDLLDLEISNPTTDVTVSVGAVIPSTTQALSGSTLILDRGVWPFNASSNYIYDSNKIEITNSLARLKASTLWSKVAGYWQMNETTWIGTQPLVMDSSNNAYHGTAYTSLDTVAGGKIGRAGSFTNVNSDRVEIPEGSCNNLEFGSTGSFTQAVWMKMDPTSGTEGDLLGKKRGVLEGYRVIMFPSGLIRFEINEGGMAGITYGVNSTSIYHDNVWHLVITQRDATDNMIKMWIDNSYIGSSGGTALNLDTVANFAIGANYTGGTEFFGLIDEAMIFNDVLTDAERTEIWNSGSGKVVSLYPTDNPTVVNATGQNFSFALNNFTETLGAGNQGSVEYQISNNGANWYYWNGSNWAQETGSGYSLQTNTAVEISAHAEQFDNDVGTGAFYFKAFLASSGTQKVELDQIVLTYDQEGSLSIDIVDSSGSSITNPNINLGAIGFKFITQTSTGTLGTSNQKIRLSNQRNTASWTVSIATVSGASAVWTSSGNSTLDFNDASGTGQLTINPSTGTITRGDGGSVSGTALGTSTAFQQGVTDSITLYSSTTATTWQSYDLTGAQLSQFVPARQEAGDYSLSLILTAV